MRGVDFPIKLFESPCGEQRVLSATEFLRGLPRTEPVLVLSATKLAAFSVVERALEPGEARGGWAKHTLESAAAEFAWQRLARSGLTRIGRVGVEALCARVVHELHAAEDLGRFREIGPRPGFVRSLGEVLTELRFACVTPEQLSAHDLDLARLLRCYEAALIEEALCDTPRLLQEAILALATSAHPLLRCPLLALDVSLVHALEAEFVRALCKTQRPMLVTVARGDEHSEGFFRLALGTHVQVKRSAPLEDHDLARLKRNLFTPHTQSEAAPGMRDFEAGELVPRVKLLSSPGENREAVEVVRQIRALADTGVAFDRLAVFLRATDAYRDVVEEALRRAQIPAHFADGVRRPVAEGRAFLSLLACAREGLSARAFAEYLSLGVAPAAVSEDEGTSAASEVVAARSPRRWEKLLVDAAVIGGRERWERRLRSLIAETKQELDACAEDESRGELLKLQHAQLNELLAFALPVLDALSALPERERWGVWLPALEALARQSLARPEVVCTALLELAPLASVGPVDLSEVERLLSRRLGTAMIPSAGTGAGKVFIGAVEDAAGRAFEHVFVLGLSEKVFPPRIVEDPLLPDEKRKALGPTLMLTEERAARERFALRLLVGAARNGITLSFSRFDMEHGRPRVPSFYGLEVLHAVDGALPAFDELARRADPGAAARMGWPAPESAALAIDDAEYDLSILDLWRARAGARKGGARYSLLSNVHLARALRFRARRWETPRFNLADGLVLTPQTAGLLAPDRLSERPYSASALAMFSGCPYRFFLHAIMKVAERANVPDLDELDARQRGVLFHTVLRGTLAKLADLGLLPLRPDVTPEAHAVLSTVFENEVSRIKEQYAPPVERLFDAALSTLFADLKEWLSRLADEKHWVPFRFELGFGLPKTSDRDAQSLSESVKLGVGLNLRGAIDLVEKRVTPEGVAWLRATDYKTGRSEGKPLLVTDGGSVLQPLLYALALEAIFPESKVDAGRLYYCTSQAGFVSHEVALNEGSRTRARDLVRAIDTMIEQGFLPAAPRVKGFVSECEQCSYRVVCGPYEAERVARIKAKDFARLAPLHALRNLP